MRTENTDNHQHIETEVEPIQTSLENSDEEAFATATQTAKKKSPLWQLLVFGVSLLAIGVGWRVFNILKNTSSVEETETNILEARLPVKVVRATSAPIQSWIFSDGRVQAVQFKHLTFEAAGTITYLKNVNNRELREGDFVRKGELLAKIDDRKLMADVTVSKAGQVEAKEQVTTAIANLKQSQANLLQAKEKLTQAQVDLEQAKAERKFAEAEMERYQALAEQGAVTERQAELAEIEFQNTQAKVAVAEASVRAAKAAVESAKGQELAAQSQVETAESGVQAANAQLSKSAVNLEDTIIKAPFNGVIAHLNIQEGDYWTPQRVQASGDYQNIVERVPIIIIDPSKFEVNLELPTFQGDLVRPGQRAFIVSDKDQNAASSGKISGDELINFARAKGKVFSVSPSVSPGERAVSVTVQVTEGAANLQDGEHVSVWIAVEEKDDATVVPLNTFVFRDLKPYVFVVNKKKGIVEKRAVEPGIEGISQREILAGVKPGELLVTEGKNRLVEGTPIEVIR